MKRCRVFKTKNIIPLFLNINYICRKLYNRHKMKVTIIYSSLLCSLCLLSLFSCKGHRSVDTPNDITFDTINTARIYHLDNDSTKPSCSLKINYIYPSAYSNEVVLAKMQSELNLMLFEDEALEKATPIEAVNEYAKAYIENYKEEAKTRFPDWQESGQTEDYFSFYKKIDTEILFDKGDILSYRASSVDDKGGAHSSSLYVNLVFDVNTGKVLTEDDIFALSYQEKLNTILKAYIVKQRNAKTIEELADLGYIGIEDLSSNNNFSVNENGISYVFNSGEYSAPSIGPIEVNLPYEEIKFLLKPDSPISHLYN